MEAWNALMLGGDRDHKSEQHVLGIQIEMISIMKWIQ